MMLWSVETRGRRDDYRFLGEPPESRWWTHYGLATSFPEPTIIAESDGSRWRLFCSGIPSKRRDRTNTVIRYTIVASGVVGEPSELVAPLVSQVLELARGNKSSELVAKLDSEFDEAFVEGVIAAQKAKDTPSTDVEVRLLRALEALSLEEADSSASVPPAGQCVGSNANEAHRRGFARAIQAMAQLTECHRLLYLNLVEHFEEIPDELIDEYRLALLTVCTNSSGPWEEVRPASSQAANEPAQKKKKMFRVVLTAVLSTIGLLLLVLLVLWKKSAE